MTTSLFALAGDALSIQRQINEAADLVERRSWSIR